MIENYNRASGQLVNKQKSSVFFSPNTEHDVKMEVRNSLGIQNEALGAKYLGLPTAVGRSTKEAFEHIPEHVRSLVSGWCEKKLNAAGRDVLLKSVAQAMPIYSMNCFKLSSVTCKKITSSISSYYWGGCPEKRKMHWLNWPNMTRSKLHGGMGFRDIATFNLAMLGKQGWRLMMKPQSLFARVLKGKYYPHCDFMQANKGKHSSHTWRAIISGRTVLNMGLIKRVGTGTEINIWEDKWIPSNPSLRPLWKPDNTHLTLVCDLIREDGTWDDHLIRNSFLPSDADAILSIPLGGLDCDTLAWAFEKHGMYSVRSAYHCLSSNAAARRHIDPTSSRGSDHPMWRLCWQLKVLPKIKHFWWRVLHEFIPTMGILKRRHIEHIGACSLCGNNDESIFHAIISCPSIKAIWKAVNEATGVKLPRLHPKTWASDIISGKVCSAKDAETITTAAYAIWTSRNKEKRGDQHFSPSKVARWVAEVLQEVSSATHPTDHHEKKLVKWNPPPKNIIKINVDGSFNPTTGTRATGCVARDSMGRILAARSRWYNSVAKPCRWKRLLTVMVLILQIL